MNKIPAEVTNASLKPFYVLGYPMLQVLLTLAAVSMIAVGIYEYFF